MMPENRCLKVNMTFGQKGNAACIGLKAIKYTPDIKYLPFLVQQRKSH